MIRFPRPDAVRRLARVLGLCLLGAVALIRPVALHGAPDAPEVRSLWVLSSTLMSPDAIQLAVTTAADAGFNTLFVQVRARGDAMFLGGVEPVGVVSLERAGFDPLAEVLRQAGEVGLAVHAWVNVNLVSSASQLPISRDHIAYRHPEWLMVPRDLARELGPLDPKNPAYLGKLARWTRGHPRELEGLYSSPLHPAAVDHTVAVVRDLVTRYPVDGVHLDYARYPNDGFDFSRAAVASFRDEMRGELTTDRLRDLDAASALDPLTYPDAYPEAWTRFRRSRMTALIMRLRTAVRQARPDAVVSAAVVADLADAYGRRLQDWATWIETGLLDAVCPLAYTVDPAVFGTQIAEARRIPGLHQVWAGIGAFRLTVPRTLENIFTARREGVDGVALFSYDSLAPNVHDQPDYLMQVGRTAFKRDLVLGSAGRRASADVGERRGPHQH